MTRKPLVVVGLDGACWELIEPWIGAGDLPVIRDLRDRSSWGPLESTVPPITCPAWKCYSSGKNPGKLGVFWWQEVDMAARTIKMPTAESFRSPELWDHLNAAGIRTGVMGMPMTFPPRDLDGFMIAGGPDAASKGYARPEGLEATLQEWDYRVHPRLEGALHQGSPLVGQILDWIEHQFEVGERLAEREPVDFLQITIFYVNWLQHHFFDGDPVREAWALIDRRIGKLLDSFENVVLMSDHGTARMRKTFFINPWLERHGYLRLTGRKPAAEYLYRLGLSKERAVKLARTLRLGDLVSRSSLAKSVARRFLLDEEGLMSDRSGAAALHGVDWQRTRVVGLPQGPLYVNRDAVWSDDEYEHLRDRLIEEIGSISDPEDGGRPIAKVFRREEIYHGPYVDSAPDLIALDADEYHNRGGMGKRELFQGSGWAGNNARQGLFLLHGPDIRPDALIDGVRIYDLAPTILRLMGCPAPDDMDGRVVGEALLP